MTKLREAAQMALDALEAEAIPTTYWEQTITALRAALAQPQQPEQEPVACDCDSPAWCKQYNKCNRVMLGLEPYVAPPQREWQGLTDEECLALWGESRWWITEREVIANARAIEAKLKEKNNK